jgi:pimeloyl-ACP methyl ester carboxylesterase
MRGAANAIGSGIMLSMQQDIKFVSETRTLAATICTPAHRSNGEPWGGVVFVHGLGSNRRGYGEYGERVAAQLGLTCLALDLSGHGSGSGYDDSFSPRQHLQDVLAAWDELTGRYGADAERIGVCGSSYGACLAALMTQHRKVARLLLRAPAIVADADLDRPLRRRSRDRDPASASVLLGGLSGFHGPALVVESGNDEEIPHEIVEGYLGALPNAGHTVIAYATHALSQPEWREAFVQQLLSFFADL